jgi:sulfotransferase family protein
VISDSIRQKLKYVHVSDPSVDLASFPDFLIVGPQRTGTTWLHANLRYHPQIMLSEPKELFFFSSLKPSDTARFGSRELADYLRCFHEPLWRVTLRQLLSLWRYRQPYRPVVRGEATASYAALDRDVIDDITTLRPEIKAILMIRNPIDRAWSHAKKDLARNRHRRLEDVSPQEFEHFFRDPYQQRCARYVENIDTWSAALQPGHLHVAVFDDIDARPEALLLEVMAFLGVRSDRRYIRSAVRQAVNPTASSRVPERYRRSLEALFADELVSLQRRFGLSWSAEQSASAPPAALGASRTRLLPPT